jgi:putative hydrolase of the HAD superfamily
LKAVLFDFGQTLVDSSKGFYRAEKNAQEAIQSDLGFPNRSEFLELYRRLRRDFQSLSNFSRPAMWRAVYRHHGKSGDTSQLLEWERRYWHTVTVETEIFPETPEVLDRLHRSYRLGLVTNSQGQDCPESHRLKEFPQLMNHFDAVVVAGESYVPAKPAPLPFRLCLDVLGVPAEEAAYVGDDWAKDICGAVNAGLRPIWLKHSLVVRNWPDVDTASVSVITSLTQLPGLLQRPAREQKS